MRRMCVTKTAEEFFCELGDLVSQSCELPDAVLRGIDIIFTTEVKGCEVDGVIVVGEHELAEHGLFGCPFVDEANPFGEGGEL